jgi:hypothetical protein
MGTFLDLARSRYIDPYNFYFIYFLTKNIAYDLLPRMGSKRSIKSAYRFVIGIRVFGTSCLRTLLWSPVLLRFWGVGCISQFSPICKVLRFWFGLFLIPPPKKLSSTKKKYKVSDESVFCFSWPMAHHDSEPIVLSEESSFDGLSERA